MSTTDNPLLDMTDAMSPYVAGLPHQAEVTMVIAAGKRRPEGFYGARVRLPYGDLIKEV